MDKGVIFDKRVGPNKRVGWNFSKTLINVQLGSVAENLSKLFKVAQFLIAQALIDHKTCAIYIQGIKNKLED